MFCSKCGNKIENGWKICPNCGNVLERAPQDNDISADNTMKKTMEKDMKSKKGKNKKYIIIGTVLAVLILLRAVNLSSSGDKKEFVQTGYLGTYDSVEVQEIIEWYAPDGEWGEGEAKEGDTYIVEYKTKDFTIQFKLDEEAEKFRVSALEDGNVDLSEAIDIKGHLDEIYDAYSVENPDSGVEADTSLECDTLQGHFGPVKKSAGKSKNEDFSDMDFAELIGKPESDLKKIGLKKSDEYLGYGALGGDVDVSCTDGKVDMIMITGSRKTTPSLYGIRIGMDEEEAYEKLRTGYEEIEGVDGNLFISTETKGSVSCKAADGKISTIMYMALTDADIEDYQKSSEEYIFPDSNQRYLSEDEVRKVEAEKLAVGRNEIFARHGYMFKDESFKEYFENTSWYEGTIPAEQFNSDLIFNDFEKKNVEMIKRIEDEINGASQQNAAQQQAVDSAYSFLVGHSFHLQDSQPLMEFQSAETIRYCWGGNIQDDYFSYSITARYEVYKDEQKEWLTFITIGGEEYYLRYFTNGSINLAGMSGSGRLDGWYEIYL